MSAGYLSRPVPVINTYGRDGIRHRIMTPSSLETIYVQEGELVGYEGEGSSTTRSSAKIAFTALYRRGVFTRAVLHYSVQSYGYSVMAVLMVTYEDAGLQGGVMPIMRIRGGSPERLGPVRLPPRFDGSMVLNEAKLTVPPNISPSGDKYIVSIAMGSNLCTFLVPRAVNQVPKNMSFSSAVSMEAVLEELSTEPIKNGKKNTTTG